MVADKLTPLQRRIVRVLATLTPPWTLTGGGALAGIHLGHRTTRDLDLFWRDRPALGQSVTEALDLLRADRMDVVVLRTAPMFSELRVSQGADVCIVDLVAEPFPAVEPPERVVIDGAAIAVDTKHEILVAKLTALLGRTELRDLVDVQALLGVGTDLVAALRDAPKKDAGFRDNPGVGAARVRGRAAGAGAEMERDADRRGGRVPAGADRASYDHLQAGVTVCSNAEPAKHTLPRTPAGRAGEIRQNAMSTMMTTSSPHDPAISPDVLGQVVDGERSSALNRRPMRSKAAVDQDTIRRIRRVSQLEGIPRYQIHAPCHRGQRGSRQADHRRPTSRDRTHSVQKLPTSHWQDRSACC